MLKNLLISLIVFSVFFQAARGDVLLPIVVSQESLLIPLPTLEPTPLPTPTPHIIPPLISVVIRGGDIPQGWAIEHDGYNSIPEDRPDILADYLADYIPIASDLIWFQTRGLVYNTPERAQEKVNEACYYYTEELERPGNYVVWNQIGDRSCVVYFGPRLYGARSSGVAVIVASFGQTRLSTWINYKVGDPSFAFAEGCIELMAQRAGFFVTGQCDLVLYSSQMIEVMSGIDRGELSIQGKK